MNKSKLKIITDILFYLLLVALVFILLSQIGVFPYRGVYVKSGSMAPTFNVGDLAVIKIESDYNPNVGDIILFSDNGSDTIHRVMEVQNNEITTKGDYNNAVDTNKINKVKGKFLFAIPLMGYVVVFIQQNILWIVMVILILILLDVLRSNNVFPFHKRNKEG